MIHNPDDLGPGVEQAAAAQAQGQGHHGLQAEGEEQGASQDQHGKDFSVNCLKTSQKMSNYQGLFVGSTCRLK